MQMRLTNCNYIQMLWLILLLYGAHISWRVWQRGLDHFYSFQSSTHSLHTRPVSQWGNNNNSFFQLLLNGGLSLSKSVYLCRVPEKPHPSHIIDLILTPFRSLIICSFLHLRQINGTPVYSLMASHSLGGASPLFFSNSLL